MAGSGDDRARPRDAQKDAMRAAWREEMARLASMGEALSDIAAAARGVDDPEALADLQDRNLAAYERMVSDAGAQALDRAQALTETMAQALRRGGDPAEGAPGSEAALDGLASTLAEIRAARDAGADAFLRELADRLGAHPPTPEPFE